MNYSNGNSFGASVGNEAGPGDRQQARDGSLPASAGWGLLAATPVWRI